MKNTSISTTWRILFGITVFVFFFCFFYEPISGQSSICMVFSCFQIPFLYPLKRLENICLSNNSSGDINGILAWNMLYSYQAEDSLWEMFCLKLPKFSFSRGSFKNKTELWVIYDQW